MQLISYAANPLGKRCCFFLLRLITSSKRSLEVQRRRILHTTTFKRYSDSFSSWKCERYCLRKDGSLLPLPCCSVRDFCKGKDAQADDATLAGFQGQRIRKVIKERNGEIWAPFPDDVSRRDRLVSSRRFGARGR
jgi:hypothetical protein